MSYEDKFKQEASKDFRAFPFKEVGVRVPGGCYTAQTHSIPIDCGYEPLFFILRDALNQRVVGKGRERHATGQPWTLIANDRKRDLLSVRALGNLI